MEQLKSKNLNLLTVNAKLILIIQLKLHASELPEYRK